MVNNSDSDSNEKTELRITENESMSHLDNIPFPAYDGDEDYAFISYSHKDHEEVYKDIKRFHDEGFNIWYDEGIRTGELWKYVIKEKIKGSKFFILFLSETAKDSSWVKKEINKAKKHHIPLVPIYIEEFEFPSDLEWLNDEQGIIRYEYGIDENYYRKCIKEFNAKIKEIKAPFPAYEGEENYIFVDYAPKDFKIVCPEIVKFHDKGFNIWYRHGISNRFKRNSKIIECLNKACLHVILMTTNSIESDAILKRMHMKPSEKILLIYLDEINKSDEMFKQLEYTLNKIRTIFKNDLTDEEYEKEYTKIFEEHIL